MQITKRTNFISWRIIGPVKKIWSASIWNCTRNKVLVRLYLGCVISLFEDYIFQYYVKMVEALILYC